MKKTLATLCLVGSTLALSSCGITGKGHVDTEPPYGLERTAKHEKHAVQNNTAVAPTPVAPAERVFRRAQTK